MIVSYNVKGIGDTLIIILKNSQKNEETFVRKGDVTAISLVDTKEIVGWNIFNASKNISNLKGNGQITLSTEQIKEVNELIKQAGFEEELVLDQSPKFVVGLVKECEKHQDSDHLSVTKILVDNDEELQIVCGAANIKQGLKVVVAKVGAMMPDGLIIWPGELRGVKSDGMVCSARELQLADEFIGKGILELEDTYEVGSAFEV